LNAWLLDKKIKGRLKVSAYGARSRRAICSPPFCNALDLLRCAVGDVELTRHGLPVAVRT
jgi:hypothetical protein